MVGVRLPRKMLKKIARVTDALSADRSTAIRSILEAGLDSGWAIGLLRSGKGCGRTGEIAVAIMAQFKASQAAEHATRAAPAKRPQAEIKALRAAEDAAEWLSRIGDRLALKQAHRPSKSEATWIEPKPPAPSVAPIRKPVKLVVRKAHPRPLQKRKLSDAEVQAIVERAMSRSEERR
jgi:hypothetical protein